MALPPRPETIADLESPLLRPRLPREERLTRILLIGRVVSKAGHHVCRARNISPNGMNLECDAPLITDDRIRVELRSLAIVEGRVAWAKDSRLGIQFDVAIDVDDFLRPHDDGTGLRPRAPRLAVTCSALVWNAGRTSVHTVHDLSQSGCRLISDAPPHPGSTVRISIPGLPPLQATARWAREREAGFAFHTMLSYAEIAAWQRGHAQSAPAVG